MSNPSTTASELRSAETGLPAQPTPLIGRDAEVAAIVGRLHDPRVRLATLTGPGGAERTRLAHLIPQGEQRRIPGRAASARLA